MDLLAHEYEGQPVVFIEYDVDDPAGRLDRWWEAWGSGGSVYLPVVMVDSGHEISNGPVSYLETYRGMVDRALQRPPLARLEVERERVGDVLRFAIDLTNESAAVLGPSNDATLHVIVYEEAHVGDTDRWVRAAASQGIPDLAPGETAGFSEEISLAGVGVDWGSIHAVVIADYRPGGSSGAHDTLQAHHE